MFGGAGWRPSPMILVGALGCAAICTVVLTAPSPGPAARPAPAERLDSPAACRLQAGDTAAFRITSTLVAEGDEDRFEGALSFEVVSATVDRAQVRAAFSQVVLTQALTRPAERAASPEGVPFFFEVGRDCALRDVRYAPTWDARTRMLVQTQLDNHAFALPPSPAARWSAAGRDGLGRYTALFRVASRAPLAITRRKTAHVPRGDAAAYGVELRVEQAEALATFDPARPQWWRSTSGHEVVVIDVDGNAPVTLRQRFAAERDDALFAPVPALDAALADGQDPFSMPVAQAAPAARFSSRAEAFDAFAAALAEGREHDAALLLAAWLKAHPEDVAPLAARLTAGDDPSQHAALFLALELSGADTARDALMGLVDDAALSGLDQARAASALAGLGAPSQPVVDRLLARADGGDMAAGVSLLGVGSMAARAEDPALRDAIVTALNTRLDAAEDDGSVHRVLDAMGNSRDAAFVDTLAGALEADSALTRRHAAAALGRLPGEVAAPRLVERLRTEDAPRAVTSLVQALSATGQRSAEAFEVMQARLDGASLEERAAIIAWLGAGRDPAAQALLVAQFHREPSARLKQRIGQFVPATALR